MKIQMVAEILSTFSPIRHKSTAITHKQFKLKFIMEMSTSHSVSTDGFPCTQAGAAHVHI